MKLQIVKFLFERGIVLPLTKIIRNRKRPMSNTRYVKIATRIWNDETIRSLEHEKSKWLFLYLLTCPHSNMIGLFVVPKLYICHDLEWTMEQLDEPFAELLDEGLIKYDDAVSVVLIPKFLKYNTIENPNQAKAGIKRLHELPQTPLIQELKQLAEQFSKHLSNCWPNGMGNTVSRITYHESRKQKKNTTLVSDSVNNTQTPESTKGKHCSGKKVTSVNTDTNTGTYTDKKQSTLSDSKNADVKKKISADEYTDDFEEVWETLYKRGVKRKAFKCWRARLREGYEPEYLKRCAKNYREFCDEDQKEKKYIKHASTFLSKDHDFENYEEKVEPERQKTLLEEHEEWLERKKKNGNT
jgi:hypothetical protein